MSRIDKFVALLLGLALVALALAFWVEYAHAQQGPEPDPDPFIVETCDGTGTLPDPPWDDQQGGPTTAFRDNGLCGFPSRAVALHGETTYADGNVCFRHAQVQGSDLRLLGRCKIVTSDLDCYGIRHIVDNDTTHLVKRSYNQTTGNASEVLISSTISRVATVNETLCLIVDGDQVCASTNNATPGFVFIDFTGSGNGCVTDTSITGAGKWGWTRRDNRRDDDFELADFGAAPPTPAGHIRLLIGGKRTQ